MQTGGSTVFPLFGFFLLESSEQMPYIVKMEPIPPCIMKLTISIVDTSFGFGQGRKWGAVKKFGVGGGWIGAAVRAKHPTGVYLRGSRLQGGSLDPFGTVTYASPNGATPLRARDLRQP